MGLILFWSLTTNLNPLLACSFFKIHPRHRPPVVPISDCFTTILKKDTDQDGIPDWRYDARFGEILLPWDSDLDDDGVLNPLDAHPLEARLMDQVSPFQLPRHLLVEAQTRQGQRTRRQQKLLFDETGLYTIVYGPASALRILTILRDLFSRALPTGAARKLSHLRYIYILNANKSSPQDGLFLEPLQAIIIRSVTEQTLKTVYQTLAHEIGHAVIFSMLSPEALATLAQKVGGWKLPLMPDSFYEPSLMKHFSGSGTISSFPSAYSYTNIHEWYAENFAHFILYRLGLQPPPIAALRQHFLTLFDIPTPSALAHQ